MFEFEHLNILYILPLPLLIWFIMPTLHHKRSALKVPFFDEMLQAGGLKSRKRTAIYKRKLMEWICLSLCWILMVMALAKPQIVGTPEKEVKNARNLLLAVDLSGSMATTDWEINDERCSRWTGVQDVLHHFIEKRNGDRIGVIFFGSQAYLQVPFTTDLNVVNHWIDQVAVGMAGGKTAMGNAIGLGIELFKKDSIDTKTMILLTDGVDSGSHINPLQAARLASKDSIVIHTVGIGRKGSGVYDLDEKSLKSIASQSHGTYFKATNQIELNRIYDTLDKMEPIEFEDNGFTPITPLYYYPLGLALGILLLLNTVHVIVLIIKRTKSDE
ncbi:VWA domain-containing protein [Halosquirtibacter xylanolyticus]|uniref:VWA domain-containing protein n=1 Tax=Halosquirtibacter xylanolyticus TaxID=3374599 RepID=UPI00374A6562|nr:VWA domain-containing protein [Prolixibacteraceae bacterium]